MGAGPVNGALRAGRGHGYGKGHYRTHPAWWPWRLLAGRLAGIRFPKRYRWPAVAAVVLGLQALVVCARP